MKIALSGYYGFDNAGDEALLSAITSTIKKLEPQATFVVLSGYPGKTARLHGLRAVNRINPCSVTRELRQSDLLISGGGSLFQDITGPFSLPYYIAIVALGKILNKPVIFYAQGVGPINRWYSKVLMRWIANRVDLITLRDQDSQKVLTDLGVTRPPVVVTADPVFTLEPRDTEREKLKNILLEQLRSLTNIIGVSVRRWDPLEGYQASLAWVLDNISQQGYKIVFIPMDFPQDVDESYKVQSLMQEPALVLNRHFSTYEHIALIENFEFMIGMRLHSLIFAASREVPFAGISYDPKIDAFLKLFELKPLPNQKEDQLRQLNLIMQDPATQRRLQDTARQFKARAEENARLALELIYN